ncbi:hypothetical protein C8T65DRAFT_534788, partial [Cerioporus squamosus]
MKLVFPTDEPTSIRVASISGWMHALNGKRVEEADMTPEQRELLLTFVCGFRAFLEVPRGVRLEDFYILAAQLVVTAVEVHPFEDAYAHLREIATWLENTLPA